MSVPIETLNAFSIWSAISGDRRARSLVQHGRQRGPCHTKRLGRSCYGELQSFNNLAFHEQPAGDGAGLFIQMPCIASRTAPHGFHTVARSDESSPRPITSIPSLFGIPVVTRIHNEGALWIDVFPRVVESLVELRCEAALDFDRP